MPHSQIRGRFIRSCAAAWLFAPVQVLVKRPGGSDSTFYVLRPPRELQRVGGMDIQCTYFGHMYSFEWMYTEFLDLNPQFYASTPEAADFVVLEHCVTYAYHVLRYGKGFDTVDLTWEALRIVQEEYLLPIIRWAESTPAYQNTGGFNFVIVFAMDKGRADYPLASRATSHWHAITTVGNGTFWMLNQKPWRLWDERMPFEDTGGACAGQVSTSKRKLIFYDQDVVVPVPIAFGWDELSEGTAGREILVFFAGSPNSCIRKLIVEQLNASADPGVFVTSHPLDRDEWGTLLFRSRFCLVPDGFSSISARLYEVLMHGCVPVLFTHAFHPPFETFIDWRRLAIFLRYSDVPRVPQILRSVGDGEYLSMHRELVRAQKYLNTQGSTFWAATNRELALRTRGRVR